MCRNRPVDTGDLCDGRWPLIAYGQHPNSLHPSRKSFTESAIQHDHKLHDCRILNNHEKRHVAMRSGVYQPIEVDLVSS